MDTRLTETFASTMNHFWAGRGDCCRLEAQALLALPAWQQNGANVFCDWQTSVISLFVIIFQRPSSICRLAAASVASSRAHMGNCRREAIARRQVAENIEHATQRKLARRTGRWRGGRLCAALGGSGRRRCCAGRQADRQVVSMVFLVGWVCWCGGYTHV